MQFAQETAIVNSVEGDFVFLETQNNASCDNCTSKSGCSSISSIFTFKPRNKLKIKNTLGLKQGDSVIVAMAPDKLLLATVLMYLLPLILMFAFALVAKLLLGEIASIVAGLFGLFGGLLFIKLITARAEVKDQFQPVLIRKVISLDMA